VCPLGRMAETSPPRPALLKTLRPVIRFTYFSPTSGYPSLNLNRYVSLVRAVHYSVHHFDHRSFQPSLCGCGLFCVALDEYLIVIVKNRNGPWTLVSTLPQEGQRQL
jgi:hypothetical protein